MDTLNKVLDIYQHSMRLAFVASYIPRKCGIATFTKDLTRAINDLNPEELVDIVAMNVNGEDDLGYPPEVITSIHKEDLDSYRQAADAINATDAELVCLQHEFGLFGGESGESIFSFLDVIRQPVVSTFHTVLESPTDLQRDIINRIAMQSEVVVAMIPEAKNRLEKIYGIPENKVVVIHHGVADQPKSAQVHKADFGWEGRRVLLMTGLFNPNKGADYVIEALPAIVAQYPETLFVIVGQTHPEVIKRYGESYRDGLKQRAAELGMTDHLEFVDEYLPLSKLLMYYEACDIYLTPHLDPQQTASGTLAYALGLGKACVSTPYTYAEGMLANEAGLLVPFKDGAAIAEAVVRIFTEPDLQKNLENRAYKIGRQMSWPRVAERYLILFRIIVKKFDGLARVN